MFKLCKRSLRSKILGTWTQTAVSKSIPELRHQKISLQVETNLKEKMEKKRKKRRMRKMKSILTTHSMVLMTDLQSST